MSNGKKCEKRSAYSKPGGYQPLCYVSDIKGKKETLIHKVKIRVVDGDTIHINKTKYRLHGIDAPEINQQCKVNGKSYACGLQSKKFLESLAQGKEIMCKQKDIDRYKRIVAVCFADGLNLNQEMVRSGWAIAYKRYSKDFVNDELFAKNNKLGIWKGTFIKPKDWRKKNN
jgi:endonuclease YncB( thermonuclease family)